MSILRQKLNEIKSLQRAIYSSWNGERNKIRDNRRLYTMAYTQEEWEIRERLEEIYDKAQSELVRYAAGRVLGCQEIDRVRSLKIWVRRFF